MSFAAVILCGGASARMGEDKARQDWGGVSAVERLAATARGLGAATVITAGADHGLPFVLDRREGPCGGVLAAAARLRRPGLARMLLLAVDAPTVALEDLAPLLAAAPPGAAYEDLPLPMAIDVAAIPPEVAADWPLKRLVEGAGLGVLPYPEAAAARLRGANTQAERAALLAGLA